jgi:hypothetical protein
LIRGIVLQDPLEAFEKVSVLQAAQRTITSISAVEQVGIRILSRAFTSQEFDEQGARGRTR